jgi:hypothetical protein
MRLTTLLVPCLFLLQVMNLLLIRKYGCFLFAPPLLLMVLPEGLPVNNGLVAAPFKKFTAFCKPAI